MTSRVWGVLAILAVGICVCSVGRAEVGTAGTAAGSPSPEAALLLRADWNCDQTPLDEWLRFVSQRCRIPVFLAVEKLRDAGIDSITPVSLELGDVPLHVALTHVLESQGLDFAPEEGIFVVSTREELELRLSTRVYPVQDLVPGEEDWSSLMMAIQDSTSAMWEQVDGEGGAMTPVPATGSLVIRQNWKTHRQIRALLTALRRAARLQDVPSIPATPLGADDCEILPPVAPGQAEKPELTKPAPVPAWQVPRRYDSGPRPTKPPTARPGTGFF